MRKIIFFIAIFFSGLSGWTQEQNFEGIVKYSVKYNGKEVAKITAKFKYPYIKSNSYDYRIIEDAMVAKNEKIILLDYNKGKISTIYESNEITSQENLNENLYPWLVISEIKHDPSLHKIFNGNLFANGFTLIHKKHQDINFDSDKTSIFWYAKDYNFTIPEKYTNYEQSVFFTNGKTLCLGMDDNEGSVTATEVLAMKLDDKEFMVSNPEFQQTNFEGIIKYSIKWNGKEKETITAHLKYPYMKINHYKHAEIKYDEKIPKSEQIIIFNYGEGKSYEIDDSAKAVKEKNLYQSYSVDMRYFEKDTSLNKKFAGNIIGMGYIKNINESPDAVLGVKNIKQWLAKEYSFSIPKEYIDYSSFNPVSTITSDKNIGLGMKITFAQEVPENYEMIATEISPGTINDSIFIIPANYKRMDVEEFYE